MSSRLPRFLRLLSLSLLGFGTAFSGVATLLSVVRSILKTSPFFKVQGGGWFSFPDHFLAWLGILGAVLIPGLWACLVFGAWIPLRTTGDWPARRRGIRRWAWAYLGLSIGALVGAVLLGRVVHEDSLMLCTGLLGSFCWCGLWAWDASGRDRREVA